MDDTVDYLTIKGGYIHELLEAFRLEYEHLQQAKPLDVVLVAGYADLPSNSLHPRIPLWIRYCNLNHLLYFPYKSKKCIINCV